MTTGMSTPSSCLRVLSLNCWQNCAAWTPWGPSAGPTGGAGVALPAGTCSLTIALTVFFAILPLPPWYYRPCATLTRRPELPIGLSPQEGSSMTSQARTAPASDLFHLQEIDLHRCRPAEYPHH